MKMTRLRVSNYKSLREIDIPLSRFTCLIGENNAGKSSVLQAFALFFSGSTLPKGHYFDPAKPIRVEVTLAAISDADLGQLAQEHQDRIGAIVKNGELVLVRLYGLDGKSALKYRKLMPQDARFSDDKINELVKGKKAGKAFVDAVLAEFPELADAIDATMIQADMKGKIQALGDNLPDDRKCAVDVDLPTGIDRSLSAMLPEPIYIPAVKDLRDDVKTTESTPFGKVLGILLKAIESDLAQEEALFQKLNAKLNRVVLPDGSQKDERLAPVKIIEQTVERFVQESFRSVTLRIVIPPPELKTVLSSASIYANDGVDGMIDTKGDGLRRAIVFAVLRSFVELNRTKLLSSESVQAVNNPGYLLLFEEPELYLHPTAQQVLFEALGVFSQKHAVMLSTHSPTFFGPQTTTSFVKMRKRLDLTVADKPFGVVHPIDLGDTNARDQFQIICYENNNIAFFADTIVLVEGDSDYIVLPHLARVIKPAWDCAQQPVRFARISGKANIRRYRQFFKRFDAQVFVITDLDFLLGKEFDQIDPTEGLRKQRDDLLVAVDAILADTSSATPLSPRYIKQAHEKGDLRALWRRVQELKLEFDRGQVSWDDVAAAIDEFFAWEKYWGRKDTLKQCPTEQLLVQKRALLDSLRKQGVCVLERGDIEDYYPDEITGDSKPARAQRFCSVVNTREVALALCTSGREGLNGESMSEFQAIFQTIFQC